MYRQYEDICVLEIRLEEAKERLTRAREKFGECADELIDLYNDVEELKERINFAWQDEEAEQFGYDY